MDIPSNSGGVDNCDLNIPSSSGAVDFCDFKPRIGMEFEDMESAYNYYNSYGRKCGFNIRKDALGRNKQTGEITSRIFVCSKEGLCTKWKKDLTKKPRVETRCECMAHMGIRLDRGKGKYVVYTFHEEHNHQLMTTEYAHMLGPQLRNSELQGSHIDLAEQSNMDISSNSGVENCDLKPKGGMEFEDMESAYNYYYLYGLKCGFNIRKESTGKNKQTGEITSRMFVCSKEGTKRKNDALKKTRTETRCECRAHMGIKLDRSKGKYLVYTFHEEHNHQLVSAVCTLMLGSQQRISELQESHVDMGEQSCIPLKESFEVLGRQTGGRRCLGFTKIGKKNYLRRRRQKVLGNEKVGCIHDHFTSQSAANPFFYWKTQFHREESNRAALSRDQFELIMDGIGSLKLEVNNRLARMEHDIHLIKNRLGIENGEAS